MVEAAFQHSHELLTRTRDSIAVTVGTCEASGLLTISPGPFFMMYAAMLLAVNVMGGYVIAAMLRIFQTSITSVPWDS